MQEDKGLVENGCLAFRRIDKVRRKEAAVELHAFDDFKFVIQALAVFNRNDAFLADLFHGLGDDVADFLIGVGADCADLSDFFGCRHRLADLLEFHDGSIHSLVDAAL